MSSHPDLRQTELMRHALESCFSPVYLNGNYYRSVYFLSFKQWLTFNISFKLHHLFLEASLLLFIWKPHLFLKPYFDRFFLLLKESAVWEIDPTNIPSCMHWNVSVTGRLHYIAVFFYLLYVSFSYLKPFLLQFILTSALVFVVLTLM